MPYRILVSAPYFLPEVERFAGYFAKHDLVAVVPDVKERLEEEELLNLITDIDGVICGDDRFTARVMGAAPRLKVISKWGTGIDSIDVMAAEKHGIQVYRTPNAFTHPVADTVLGYILCFARNLPFMNESMKRGEWKKIPGRAINETTIGVIGVGAIGSAVLQRAKPFGAKLLGTDVREIEERLIDETGVRMTTLHELLTQSDYISINCDLTDKSYHLLNDATFSVMQSHAVVVNAARGPVIEEPALVRALQSNKLAGAALDVFEDEPLPADSPLRRIDNVLIAPHNSNSSPSAWERVHLNTLEQLVSALNHYD